MATQMRMKRKPTETLRIPNCPWTEIQWLTELDGGSGSFDPSLYRARPPSFLPTPNKRRSPTLLFTLFPSNSGSRPAPTTEAVSGELRRVTESTTVRRNGARRRICLFVEQSSESAIYLDKKKAQRSWWSFGWSGSSNNANEPRGLTEEDWEQLNKIIGYKEAPDEVLSAFHDDMDLPQLFLEIHMKHNASKLIAEGQNCLADLSCEGLVCSLKTYSEAKVFNLKLGSYKLSSPYGLLAKNATVVDSLVRIFSYKPFDAQVDWNFAAKASPCYITVHERKETGEVDVLTKARKGLLCNRMKTGGRKTKT